MWRLLHIRSLISIPQVPPLWKTIFSKAEKSGRRSFIRRPDFIAIHARTSRGDGRGRSLSGHSLQRFPAPAIQSSPGSAAWSAPPHPPPSQWGPEPEVPETPGTCPETARRGGPPPALPHPHDGTRHSPARRYSPPPPPAAVCTGPRPPPPR